jgi:protein-histidine pros-kinase
MLSLTGIFAFIFIALNLMLRHIVIQPVTQLSQLADRVSLGEQDVPEFSVRSRDEIGVLADSFGRLRKSLSKAMKMLED